MIDIQATNKLFATIVIEALEDEYNIIFIDEIIPVDGTRCKLLIHFSIDLHECNVTQDINYKVQKIGDLITVISEKINKEIVKSYIK